jgi:DNA-binding response OmpR family regulator
MRAADSSSVGLTAQPRLPDDRSAPAEPPAVPSRELSGDDCEMILIVDDEPSALVLLEMVLRRDGHLVRKAATGKEALRLLDREDEQRCDLLITDIRMPEMDGRELVNRLRTNPAYSSIPVIMCTSTSDRATVVELIGRGVRDYIVKPFKASAVSEKVRAIVGEQDPVIEPRSKTAERLEISPDEYVPLATATVPTLDGIEDELAAALRGRNVRAVRGAAERVREPASLFGARRVISAARSVTIADSDAEALQSAGVLLNEIGVLRSMLVRVGSAGAV